TLRSRRVLERASRAATDDRLVARLPFLAGLPALRRDPCGGDRVATALAATLAAAQRVVGRVHTGATIVGLAAFPPHPPGLADADVHVLGMRHAADGRPALHRHLANLTARQGEQRPLLLAVLERRAATGRAAHLPALTRHHLDVVDGHAERDLPQRHA